MCRVCDIFNETTSDLSLRRQRALVSSCIADLQKKESRDEQRLLLKHKDKLHEHYEGGKTMSDGEETKTIIWMVHYCKMLGASDLEEELQKLLES